MSCPTYKWFFYHRIYGPRLVTLEGHHRIFSQDQDAWTVNIHATSVQGLHPRPCTDNVHPSVLDHEMMAIEAGENSSRRLTWKPTDIHIQYSQHMIIGSSYRDLALFLTRCSTFGPDMTSSTMLMSTFWIRSLRWSPSNLSDPIHRDTLTVHTRYLVLSREQDNCRPPRPLILDFTMTHDRLGRSRLHSTGQFTHTGSSDGCPHPM